MLLCDTTNPMTSKRHLWALVNRDRTRRYNWVKLVLGWLCEEVKKYKTKKQTYCRVRIEGFDVPDVIPRMAAMSDSLVC